MRTKIILWAVVAALLLAQCLRSEEKLEWLSDYATARAESSRTGKLLVLKFDTEPCVWCQRQDKELLNWVLAAVLRERCVLLRVKAADSPGLVQSANVTCYPTIVIAAPDGTVKDTLEGFHHAAKVDRAVIRALRK